MGQNGQTPAPLPGAATAEAPHAEVTSPHAMSLHAMSLHALHHGQAGSARA